MSKTQPARGMRDFLPADIRKRNYVIGIIKEVYESYGFEPLETPAVENLETLTGKYGEEGSQLMFRILKRGEKLDVSQGEKGLADLALRYDLTVPLARVVANYKNELPRFFKRYQIQPVWRADRPAKGRFREFYQCDVDAIGSNSMLVEAELISAVSEILERLGFEFAIHLNNRNVLMAILDVVGIAKDKHSTVLIAIDKIEKIGAEKFQEELLNQGIEQEKIEILGSFMSEFYTRNSEILNTTIQTIDGIEGFNTNIERRKFLSDFSISFITDFIAEHKEGNLGIEELRKILEYTKYNKHIFVDIALARGLSYYTGTIMEITLREEDFSLDSDFVISVGGGGRYDGLIGMFGKEQIPACGFSLGLERILVVMEERGMFPPELQTNSADVLVTVWDEKTVGESLKLANELRSNGLRVLVYPEADKLGKQFKYADSIGIKTAIILRDEEIAENKVKVKNLQTSEEETFAREEIAEKIKSR